ncbi:hypothetical protein LCGC14_1462730, partial [marine sediment metagenome]
ISSVYIEYIPQISLENGAYWYLPDTYDYVAGSLAFEAPFFISEVFDNNMYYGTYIHPDQHTNGIITYTIQQDVNGRLYVDFDTPPLPQDNPRGAVHFARINDQYSNRFGIEDYLLFNYDLLEAPSDLSSGTLYLTLNTGFNDIMDGTEMTQVSTDQYYITVSLYKIDSNDNLVLIGSIIQPITSPSLSFGQQELEINLNSFNINAIGEAMTQGYGNDLIITIESSISNSIVDANLFRGHYAQQILDARLELETDSSDLYYNSNPVLTPYIELVQNNIQLKNLDNTQFQFKFEDLNYDFDFSITELRTESNTLISRENYFFTQNFLSITLDDPYSGLIYANISYNAFEWNIDYISTLEPITMSFPNEVGNDFISRYTKYLEIKVQYYMDGIPGYEISKLDTSSGRVVMTNEEKGGELLKIYLFNQKTSSYDYYDFVVYDNFGESESFLPTFSYIIDRNFITFEDYFKKVGSTFEISFLFVVDENFDDYFTSQISFNIASISSKVYYDPSNVERFLNPAVEFDVDLSNYYSGSGTRIDELTLGFDYISSLLFDESSIFSQYALIEESYSFYIQNKFMEFQQYALIDDKLSLSEKELSELLKYDANNDKYFIRLKIEHDWSAILEVNLGGTSRIEIISILQLLKYNMNVKYTSIETTRISAQETSNNFELRAINAPNYVETISGIVTFADDNEIDIGLNNQFLRNKDTRQRLMIKQELSYDFPDSQQSPISILIDQSYTDAILRFTKPTGFLKEPHSIYLNNSQLLSFEVDFEVSSVDLYWYNGIENLIGSMQPNPSKPNLFEYFWDTIDTDTGAFSGDTIEIIVRLTDVYSITNDYHHYFEADFIPPSSTISIGDGIQDFRSTPTDPFTDIAFDDGLPDNTELWNENFASYNPSYMSQADYPDNYGNTQTMNPLDMKNNFPAISAVDGGSGWNLNSDPSYTTSSYNGGQLISQLNSGTNAKIPDTIQINDGSLVSAGDLNNVGDTYSTYLSTNPIVNYGYNNLDVPLQNEFDNPLTMGMWGTYIEDNFKYDDEQFSTILSGSDPIYYGGTDVPLQGEFSGTGDLNYQGDLGTIGAPYTTIGGADNTIYTGDQRSGPHEWNDWNNFAGAGIYGSGSTDYGTLSSNDGDTNRIDAELYSSYQGGESYLISYPSGDAGNVGWVISPLTSKINSGVDGTYITGEATDYAYFDMGNVVIPANNYLTRIIVYAYRRTTDSEFWEFLQASYRFEGYTAWSTQLDISGYGWAWDAASWGGLWGNSYTDTHADALQVRLDTERVLNDNTKWDVDSLYARIYYAPLVNEYKHEYYVKWDINDA